MKGLKTLTAIGLGAALLAAAAPANAQGAAFRHYVACGLSQKAEPSHVCPKRSKKGAFFRSNRTDVFYTVCAKFPGRKTICRPQQKAVQGTLYVNRITSTSPGKHRITWFVEGGRVGAFNFFVPPR